VPGMSDILAIAVRHSHFSHPLVRQPSSLFEMTLGAHSTDGG
jgi:hypothetical protein